MTGIGGQSVWPYWRIILGTAWSQTADWFRWGSWWQFVLRAGGNHHRHRRGRLAIRTGRCTNHHRQNDRRYYRRRGHVPSGLPYRRRGDRRQDGPHYGDGVDGAHPITEIKIRCRRAAAFRFLRWRRASAMARKSSLSRMNLNSSSIGGALPASVLFRFA